MMDLENIGKETEKQFGLTVEETMGYVKILRVLGLSDHQIVARLKELRDRHNKVEGE